MIEIYDDLFTDDYLINQFLYASNGARWKLNNRAGRFQYPLDSPLCKGNHLFWAANLDANNEFVNAPLKVFHEITDRKYKCIEVLGNLQGYGVDGTWHQDDGRAPFTLLFYPHYKWKKSWGGEFQIERNGNIESFDIKPGRLILIDGSINHRALGTKNPYIYRFSYAYRLDYRNKK